MTSVISDHKPAFGPWHSEVTAQARIVCDSISTSGARLVTFEIRMWRAVLAELNTHRTFTRSSGSTRAVPVNRAIELVENDPFIPEYWGLAQPGMSARAALTDPEGTKNAREAWLRGRDRAVETTRELLALGLHKQVANRPLETYAWHTVLLSVTETELPHFFALRNHPDAQPEMQAVARMVFNAHQASVPTLIQDGDWHLPLLSEAERTLAHEDPLYWRKVSTGRCARASYLTHAGVRDLDKDIELHDSLLKDYHMSPTEHVARPATADEGGKDARIGNFRGWVQYRKEIPFEDNYAEALAVLAAEADDFGSDMEELEIAPDA